MSGFVIPGKLLSLSLMYHVLGFVWGFFGDPAKWKAKVKPTLQDTHVSSVNASNFSSIKPYFKGSVLAQKTWYSGVQVLLHTPFTMVERALLPWNNSFSRKKSQSHFKHFLLKKHPQIPGGENICLVWLCRAVWNKVPAADLNSQSERPWEMQILWHSPRAVIQDLAAIDESQSGFMFRGLARWMGCRSDALCAGLPFDSQNEPAETHSHKYPGVETVWDDRSQQKWEGKKRERRKNPINFRSLNLKQGDFPGQKGKEGAASSGFCNHPTAKREQGLSAVTGCSAKGQASVLMGGHTTRAGEAFGQSAVTSAPHEGRAAAIPACPCLPPHSTSLISNINHGEDEL